MCDKIPLSLVTHRSLNIVYGCLDGMGWGLFEIFHGGIAGTNDDCGEHQMREKRVARGAR